MILSVFKEFYNMQKNLFSSPLSKATRLSMIVFNIAVNDVVQMPLLLTCTRFQTFFCLSPLLPLIK